ncbi:GNAT family N-acetyltransferase [Kineosporia rhizophila]|uniref:GNAT family N-acetyltransferase n=1 Tax=Kineosporia TaxID=49184 RepID=UPI001E6081EA|nr:MULTISPECIES: GNAT family N-acetyltransferase [Kineosporia]MCE0539124.1 GNAT family N-acetyltransferase [Kineosporia rhizophila]GLY18114.1 acetyltransferase [Kineosporia sp. NBRC 101677]
MGTQLSWPVATYLESARLDLEPLRPEHAEEAYPWMSDERIHAFTGGRPGSLDELRERFRRQAEGHSPDGLQGWLNWMIRHRTGRLVGTVQATVTLGRGHVKQARLGWVLAFDAQGHGFAREAAGETAIWLMGHGVQRLTACIHPRHRASKGVARAIGLHPTIVVVDGEIEWTNDEL